MHHSLLPLTIVPLARWRSGALSSSLRPRQPAVIAPPRRSSPVWRHQKRAQRPEDGQPISMRPPSR
jgi:hypothetical protein